jgi:hypothetical protein
MYNFDPEKTYVFVLEIKGSIGRIFTSYEKVLRFLKAYLDGAPEYVVTLNEDRDKEYIFARLETDGKLWGFICRKELE